MNPYKSEESPRVPVRRFRCRPGVLFAVELDGVTIIEPGAGTSLRLGYPDAAVWDLLCRGYAFDTVAGMLGHIAAMRRDEAARAARETICQLLDQGFLEET